MKILIDFLFVASIIWAIVSFLGYISFFHTLMTMPKFMVDRYIASMRIWPFILDVLTIAFWIALFINR